MSGPCSDINDDMLAVFSAVVIERRAIMKHNSYITSLLVLLESILSTNRSVSCL